MIAGAQPALRWFEEGGTSSVRDVRTGRVVVDLGDVDNRARWVVFPGDQDAGRCPLAYCDSFAAVCRVLEQGWRHSDPEEAGALSEEGLA